VPSSGDGLAGEVVGSRPWTACGVIAVPAFDTARRQVRLPDQRRNRGHPHQGRHHGKLDFGQPVFADNLLLVPTWGRGLIAYHPKPGLP